jgi:hypothetical protein
MNEQKITERLVWLGNIVAVQRNNIANLMAQMRGIGQRAGTSLAMHLKFTHLMEQISYDREKELDILHEIESVEKRHRELKERKMLRRAEPEKAMNAKNDNLRDFAEEKPKRVSLLTLLGLLYLFASKPIKHKNQSLTVD